MLIRRIAPQRRRPPMLHEPGSRTSRASVGMLWLQPLGELIGAVLASIASNVRSGRSQSFHRSAERSCGCTWSGPHDPPNPPHPDEPSS